MASLQTYLTDADIGLASQAAAVTQPQPKPTPGSGAAPSAATAAATDRPSRRQPFTNPAADTSLNAASPVDAAAGIPSASTAKRAGSLGGMGAPSGPSYTWLSLRENPDTGAIGDLGPPERPGPSFRAQEMEFADARALRTRLGRELLTLLRNWAQHKGSSVATGPAAAGAGAADRSAAAAADVVRRATAWLDRGAPPDFVEPAEAEGSGLKRTPLYWACVRGDAALVELLLRYGADPTQPMGDGSEAWPAAAGSPGGQGQPQSPTSTATSFAELVSQAAAKVQRLPDPRPASNAFRWVNLARGFGEAPYTATGPASTAVAPTSEPGAGQQPPSGQLASATVPPPAAPSHEELAAYGGGALPAAGNSSCAFRPDEGGCGRAVGPADHDGHASAAAIKAEAPEPLPSGPSGGEQMAIDGEDANGDNPPYFVRQYRRLLELLGFSGSQLQLLVEGLAEVRRCGGGGGAAAGGGSPLPVRVTMRAAGGYSAAQLRDMVLERYGMAGVPAKLEDATVAGHGTAGG